MSANWNNQTRIIRSQIDLGHLFTEETIKFYKLFPDIVLCTSRAPTCAREEIFNRYLSIRPSLPLSAVYMMADHVDSRGSSDANPVDFDINLVLTDIRRFLNSVETNGVTMNALKNMFSLGECRPKMYAIQNKPDTNSLSNDSINERTTETILVEFGDNYNFEVLIENTIGVSVTILFSGYFRVAPRSDFFEDWKNPGARLLHTKLEDKISVVAAIETHDYGIILQTFGEMADNTVANVRFSFDYSIMFMPR